VHLDRVLEDVADYNAMVTVPVSIPTLVDLAVRTALARRSVAHITVPVDIQEADPDLAPYEGGLNVARHPETAAVYLPSPSAASIDQLERAAAVLNEGARVAMLVGVGALGARDQVLAVADRLASPIVKSLPGKAVVPDDHVLTCGGLGLLGTRPSTEAMEGCDTLLMVGTNYPYTAYLPEKARVVQVELDPTRAGNRMPTEVPLIGDAATTLQALLPLLEPKADRSFLEGIQRNMVAWRDDLAALEDADRTPIQPQYVARTLDRLAAEDAILCTDSGTITTWAARHFDIRGDRQFYLCSNLASMACGLPYAIATQLAYSDRQVIAFVGDGGFAMLMAEFLTAARYQLPITVVVANNGGLGQILWEQMMLGYPEHGVRWERPADFALWAQACGGLGRRVEDPAQLEAALADALAFDGPALVDVVVNPDEPPMPPKIRYDQAKGFAESFLRGQPRRAAIASTLLHDRLNQLRS
jgi:pyruvate dehydrogenase (quinone)